MTDQEIRDCFDQDLNMTFSLKLARHRAGLFYLII